MSHFKCIQNLLKIADLEAHNASRNRLFLNGQKYWAEVGNACFVIMINIYIVTSNQQRIMIIIMTNLCQNVGAVSAEFVLVLIIGGEETASHDAAGSRTVGVNTTPPSTCTGTETHTCIYILSVYTHHIIPCSRLQFVYINVLYLHMYVS